MSLRHIKQIGDKTYEVVVPSRVSEGGSAERAEPFDLPSERWWRNGQKPKKDMQRRRAYRAENAALPHLDQRRFADIREVAIYLRDLIETEWFRRRWPKFRSVVVKHRKMRNAWARSWVNSGQINMGTWALGGAKPALYKQGGEWLALHEFAHVLAGPGHHHDALWARIYVELVTFKMGREAGDALKASFNTNRVRWKFYANRKPMSEEQRAAFAARMRTSRAAVLGTTVAAQAVADQIVGGNP